MSEVREPALRIVFLSANPPGTFRIAANAEVNAMEQALKDRPGEFLLDSFFDATADTFMAAVAQSVDIVHISAHYADGRLRLHDRAGRAFVSPRQIAQLLKTAAKRPRAARIVILNSCDTAGELGELCEQVECAIGMSRMIDERTAVMFSSAFYSQLALGGSIEAAFEAGKARLQMFERPGDDAPMMQTKAGVDPSRLVLLPLLVADQEHSGRMLGNRYQVLNKIGGGSTAKVYRALDRREGHNTEVAIKVLREENIGNLLIERRFFRGAEVMASLSHPNIARVLDIGPRSCPDRYFVMDLFPPWTLMSYASAADLTWEQVLYLGLEVASGLAHAHELSYIHRDVKPDNILIDANGHAVLIDFDLAREEYSAGGGTVSGPMGSFQYSAPEVLTRPQGAEYRCDQYSLAMTLAATLAQRDPTKKDRRDPEVFVASLPCPKGVQVVLRKALHDDIEERYGTMRAFYAALSKAMRAEPVAPGIVLGAPGPSNAVSDGPAPPNAVLADPGFSSAVLAGPASSAGLAGLGASGADHANPESSSAAFAVPGISSAALANLESPSNMREGAPPRTNAVTVARRPWLHVLAGSFVAGSAAGVLVWAVGAFAESKLDAALQVDHSRSPYSIRITADDTLDEARQHAQAIVDADHSWPWIVRKGRLFYVFIGDYATAAVATRHLEQARALRNEGALVIPLQEHCPVLLQHRDEGYHDCLDKSP